MSYTPQQKLNTKIPEWHNDCGKHSREIVRKINILVIFDCHIRLDNNDLAIISMCRYKVYSEK